jgi:hypothetical protein
MIAQITAAIGLGRLLATHEAGAGETPPPHFKMILE